MFTLFIFVSILYLQHVYHKKFNLLHNSFIKGRHTHIEHVGERVKKKEWKERKKKTEARGCPFTGFRLMNLSK